MSSSVPLWVCLPAHGGLVSPATVGSGVDLFSGGPWVAWFWVVGFGVARFSIGGVDGTEQGEFRDGSDVLVGVVIVIE